jgi:hypothetical protein
MRFAVLESAHNRQTPSQTGRSPLWRSTSFKPGQSGNPLGGALLKLRNEAQRKRLAELNKAVLSEFPKPTALEKVLIAQVADLLERAGRPGGGDTVRLSRCAMQVLDKIREGRKAKVTPKGSFSVFGMTP